MRTRQSLNGTWSCKPLAWTIIQKDGSERVVDQPLPVVDSMELPCNWHLGGLPNFFGRVSFQREFQYQKPANEKTFLCFGGVDYRCKVYLNQQPVGAHTGCFQSFDIDVTDALRDGNNVLEVIVDSPNEEPGEVWPHQKWLIKGILSHWDGKPGGWDMETGQDGNTGGVWGDIALENRSAIHIVTAKIHSQILPKRTPDEVFIQNWEDKSQLDATPRAYVWTNIRLSETIPFEKPLEIAVTLTDEDGKRHAKTFAYWGTADQSGLLVMDEPKLWWSWDLGHPHLYQVSIAIAQAGQQLDEVQFKTGLREIEFEQEEGIWKINGKRQFIRGTNVIPTMWLGEYSKEKIDRDIQLLRDAHINGVRVCVHINRREWYEACDRAGIVIWQDFLLQWGYANDLTVAESATIQIKDMIRQLYNHPSIGLWCCQNESLFFNNEIVGPQLARAAKEEDSSRFVHPTSEFHEHPYNGWYNGTYQQYELLPGGRLITEFGAQALPSVPEVLQLNGSAAWPPNWKQLGYHNFQYDQTFYNAKIDPGESWETFVENSQTYQAKLLKTGIEAFRKSRFEKVGSMFQFMFMDAWPSVTWSVVSHARIPKKGYYTLQQAYQPVLAGGAFRDHWPVTRQYGGMDDFISFAPWVINDYQRTFVNCQLTISIRGKDNGLNKVLNQQSFTLPNDTLLTLDTVRFAYFDLYEPGKYEMVFTITHEGKPESVNQYDILID